MTYNGVHKIKLMFLNGQVAGPYEVEEIVIEGGWVHGVDKDTQRRCMSWPATSIWWIEYMSKEDYDAYLAKVKVRKEKEKAIEGKKD